MKKRLSIKLCQKNKISSEKHLMKINNHDYIVIESKPESKSAF